MEIDNFIDEDKFNDDNNNEPATRVQTITSRSQVPLIKKNIFKVYLTKDEFDYTINLLTKKIDSIYKLCRYMGEKQGDINKDVKRLIALDELSEEF